MKKDSIITREELLSNGWQETEEDAFLLEKSLTPEYEREDGELKMVVHRMYNAIVIALQLPDGGLLNLNLTSIDDLNSFIKKISSYDPPY